VLLLGLQFSLMKSNLTSGLTSYMDLMTMW